MASIKKKTAFNIVMVAAIAVIVAGALLAVGSLQGWFSSTVDALTATDKVGNVNIERGGIAYALEDGTEMRDGDIVQTLAGSSVSLASKGATASLDKNSEVKLGIVADAPVEFGLNAGAMFIKTADAASAALGTADTEVHAEGAVLSVDALHGSAGVRVYGGTVTAGGREVRAGQSATFLSDGSAPEISELSLQSLSAFDISHLKSILDTEQDEGVPGICFSKAEIESLEAERTAQAEQANAAAQGSPISEHAASQEGTAGSVSGGAANGGANAALTCTITIQCDSVLSNMDKLAGGKDRFVPADGIILAASTISFTEGETVFDVLKRACSLADIQLEYSWTPAYNSHYIEGINNLYEFDCGPESGWTYRVNGWKPNYGCSAYALQNGDVVVWSYSCEGAGQW